MRILFKTNIAFVAAAVVALAGLTDALAAPAAAHNVRVSERSRVPAKKPAIQRRGRSGSDADARKCLEFSRNAEIIRCANAYL